MYIKIPKPGAQTYTKIQKDPSNMPTYGVAIYGVSKYGLQNTYIKITKPAGTTYTKIPKPT